VELLRVSVQDVLAFRSFLLSQNAAPKTLNRRVSSLSSFYKYLAAASAELRLPITAPNPAHAQFISRDSTDPREETRSLSAARARQLVGLPAGNSVLDFGPQAPVGARQIRSDVTVGGVKGLLLKIELASPLHLPARFLPRHSPAQPARPSIPSPPARPTAGGRRTGTATAGASRLRSPARLDSVGLGRADVS
jgi:hypothetical protein